MTYTGKLAGLKSVASYSGRSFKLALLPLAVAMAPAQALQPAAVDLGPFKVVPSLAFNTGHDDNIFLTENNTKESWVTIINPAVELIAQDGANSYSINYAFAKGFYHSSSQDNYLDHTLEGEVNLELNSRNAIDLRAAFLRGHEGRGTGPTAGDNALFNPKPVKYEEREFNARYTLGSEESTGRLELEGGYENREYVSFREQNAGRDRATRQLAATFYYRLAPKTDALFEIRRKDVDYDLETSLLDSEEATYLLGVTWEATAKTTGSVKIGQTDKDFDREGVEGDQDPHWEVSVDWSPRTYSTVSLMTNRRPEETDSNGTYIDRTGTRLSWHHEWSDYLASTLSAGRMNSDYVSSVREDDEDELGLSLTYSMRRWLDLGFHYLYSDRDSNINGLSYEKNTIYFSVNVAL